MQNITPIYFINPTHQDQGHLTYAIININQIVNIYNMELYNHTNYNSKTSLCNKIFNKALETLLESSPHHDLKI